MGILLITRFTLLEALRRRLFLAIVVLSILILAAFSILLSIVVSVSLANNSGNEQQLYLLGGGVIISVLAIWMVYLLSSTLTIIFTANMISGEVESGTFTIIVPKPLRRSEIVLGKWLGYALIIFVYNSLMFFSFLAVIYWKTGYWPDQAFSALGILTLGMLVLLGITTLGSSMFPTIVNGAIALMLFIGAPVASIIQFVVQFLNPTSLPAIQNISTVINLIIPTDALWHGTSFFLLPPAVDFATLGISTQTFNTPFTSGEPLAPALLIWSILYCLVLPALAVLRFQRRDL